MYRPDALPQLRIAVNSRCGRACFYCRPSGEALPTGRKEELTADTTVSVVSACARAGIRSVKLTGGDPALWGPLVETVGRLKRETPIEEIQVISRHPKIGDLAARLADNGADVINISLDTLNGDLHRAITGIGDLTPLIQALRKVVASGVRVKVNVVVMKGINTAELDELITFCEEMKVHELKFLDVIGDLDAGSESFSRRLRALHRENLRDLYTPLMPIVESIRKRAISSKVVTQGSLGHPMTSLLLASGLTVLIKDHHAGAWYGSICSSCPHFPCHDALMALRLTADLRLQFCLLREDVALELRPLFDKPQSVLDNAVLQALEVYKHATFTNASSPLDGGPQI